MGGQSANLGSATLKKPPQGLVDFRVGCNPNSMARELPRKFRQPEGSDLDCGEVIHLTIPVALG